MRDPGRGARDGGCRSFGARTFAGADPFLVLNSDNYYPVDVLKALVALDGRACRRSSRGARSPGQYRSRSHPQLCRAEIDGDGFLEDIVEKPDEKTFARYGDDTSRSA